VDHRVDRLYAGAPARPSAGQRRPLGHPPFAADRARDARQLARELLLLRDELVERVADLPGDTGPAPRQADGEVAVPRRLEDAQEGVEVASGELAVSVS